MNENRVKSKLAKGEAVIGSFAFIPSAALTEILGLIGFDFVVIDLEHGPIGYESAESMVRAAEITGTTPFIRVSKNTDHLILRALDIGAMGVHVPEVGSAEDAQAVVSSAKYGPWGRRGLASVRAARYGMSGSLHEYTQTANRETMVIAHLEDVKAIRNLDEILQVEGIDVFYLGPVDLSNSLGIPGKTKDEAVANLVDDAIRRIVAAGKTAGCIASDLSDVRHYIDFGAKYIATHAIRIMDRESRKFIEELRS